MMGKIMLVFKLARWHYTPLIIIPVVLGAVLAWYQGHAFRWSDFVLCLVGSWFAHLGANAANDCFDDVSGVDRIAHEAIHENRGTTVCGSGILTMGQMTRKEGFIATAVFFVLAAACGIPLVIRVGWPIAAIAAAGFFLAVFYCARPIAFGYIGRGLGELGILIAFGPLPTMGSYWVQAGSFSWPAVLASIPVGLFTVSVLYNHHFTHIIADAAVKKKTPAVVLGERRARALSPVILIVVYAAIAMNVALGIFPWPAVCSLVTAPFILKAYAKITTPAPCFASLVFLLNVVKANVTTGVLLICSLVFTRALM